MISCNGKKGCFLQNMFSNKYFLKVFSYSALYDTVISREGDWEEQKSSKCNMWRSA